LKRRIAIAGAVVVLLGCSAAVAADESRVSTSIKYKSMYPPKAIDLVLGSAEYDTMLEVEQENRHQAKRIELAKKEALAKNKKVLKQQLDRLSNYVGKTRYVFSGSTPRGWDCSGLVRWFYLEIGVDAPHSATKQGLMKPKVKDPVPGDIVVFRYTNSKNFVHSGIYIGDGQLIHSGFKKGDTTEIISLDSPYFKNQDAFFVRVIEN
jgi:peptidoglycan DL-endopeptidase LytE